MWGGPVFTLTISTARLVPLTITASRWVPARFARERLFSFSFPSSYVPLFWERANCALCSASHFLDIVTLPPFC